MNVPTLSILYINIAKFGKINHNKLKNFLILTDLMNHWYDNDILNNNFQSCNIFIINILKTN